MSEKTTLKDLYDAAVSGAILIVAIVVLLVIWKIAQALGYSPDLGGTDPTEPDTDFGEGSLWDGEYFEGPIW